jgi:3-hydroxyacyl-[acyl-carrier-protein] dehydratase
MWDPQRILATLPHRFPFLLVDRILEVTDTGAVGLKQVSFNEWFFQGHFPGRPVMPGVLVVEAMAQVGAVALLSRPEHEGQIPYFAGIDGVRFRRPVEPGDTLRLEVELTHLRSRAGKARGRALVDGHLAAAGELMFALGPAERDH